MTTDTAEKTLVVEAKTVTNELTVNETRKIKAENHAMNFALIGGDVAGAGYNEDPVARMLSKHPMAFSLN